MVGFINKFILKKKTEIIITNLFYGKMGDREFNIVGGAKFFFGSAIFYNPLGKVKNVLKLSHFLGLRG